MGTSAQNPAAGLREAFDAAASTYDQQFESLAATRRVRRIMWDVYRKYFKQADRLLELNCGTGTDAIALAQRGMSIHATDVSERMLEIATRKIASLNLASCITTGLLPLDDLWRLGSYEFDGVYSNFGGLNCLGDLRPIARDLAELVHKDGYLIACLMTDFALWETLSFLLRGKLTQALRRRNPHGVQVNMHGHAVRTYYYSPRKVTDAFVPFFECVEVGGLNIFTPPPSSQNAYSLLGKSVRILKKLDDALFRTYPFHRAGDHFYIVLRRTNINPND